MLLLREPFVGLSAHLINTLVLPPCITSTSSHPANDE